ncbi:GNAT family N-acetyltransferase, partial [Chloroflexota bacterium]
MHSIEKATIDDAPHIHKLVNEFASKGEMLARPLSEIYESIRDFIVVKEDGRVIGCGALHVIWSDLVEVRSVAVAADKQHLGIGSI